MVRKTMVDGQTMVDHWLRKPDNETCEPGSSPPIGSFIFYFFNIFCPPEAQNHLSTKISAKY
jgi:hypothetical protein